MLKQLSRLKHTSRIIVLGFVLLMGVSLIFFYAPRTTSNTDPSRNNALVAKVGSEEITVAEVTRRKEDFLQMFGGRASIAQLGGYKRFVEGLIKGRVVAQEAARLGLTASDEEARER